MNGMMMAASSGEQNAGVSVNASDAGRERFATRYEDQRDSPWNSLEKELVVKGKEGRLGSNVDASWIPGGRTSHLAGRDFSTRCCIL